MNADHPELYIESIPEERKKTFSDIRNTILSNLPEGFEETMIYGMIGYVVPKSIYPAGYHCNSKDPLPFMQIANQKNFIALYHMGIYADEQLLNWFTKAYSEVCKSKLDMGKSCIRFKKMEDIPLQLIGELASKMTVKDWISLYEFKFKK